MGRRKKKRTLTPPLSSLDKCVYHILEALSVAAGFFMYPAVIGAYRSSVFQDPRILAQNNYGILILGVLGLLPGAVFHCGRAPEVPGS